MISRFGEWWFPPAPARRPAALRVLVGGYALYVLWTRFDKFAAIARTPSTQWAPVGPLRFVDAPLSPALFDVWNVVHLLLAAAFVAGLGWRVLAPIYAASTVLFFTYRTSWGGVLHGDNLLTLQIVCLALGPAASAWSADAWLDRRWPAALRFTRWPTLPTIDWRFGWLVRLIATVTTLTYLLAGVAKLAVDPLGWWRGDSLVDQVGNDALYKELVSSGGASPLVPWAYQHLGVLGALAILTLVIEVGAPLALLDRRLGWLWSFGAWSMHEGIELVMGIVFPYPLSTIAFACFFPIDTWVERAWEAARRAGAGRLPGLRR